MGGTVASPLRFAMTVCRPTDHDAVMAPPSQRVVRHALCVVALSGLVILFAPAGCGGSQTGSDFGHDAGSAGASSGGGSGTGGSGSGTLFGDGGGTGVGSSSGGTVVCPSGLQCNVSCSGGTTTSVSGKVYDPALKNGLYNIAVYVPASPLQPLPKGVPTGADACDCATLFPSGAVVSTTTGVDGTFTLPNAPVGSSVPIVLQV